MKKVLTFGTFDVLHLGHEHYLKEAKKHGSMLYVVVARDKTVYEVKGKKPLNDEAKRLDNIKSLKYVDGAYLGYEDDKYRIIEEINPDVIVFGYDQNAFTKNIKDILSKRGLNIEMIRLPNGLKPDVYKSSKLRLGRINNF
ncbi:MAG: adenylyltransferase/cytidyltransferase family protein [Nanoarchaeota archaeon]|nr:adenylyltransferase/cytidyltransferase family protein [Nanoarchaeota archaeon]